MKKSKKLLIGVAITVLVTVAAVVGITYSYLIDVETIDNIITIGNVSLRLDEGAYHDTDIVSQSKVAKAPSVTNNGTNDEYVFLKVMVPKKLVTLLYETDTDIQNTHYNKGEIIAANKEPALAELFRMQTTSNGTAVTGVDGADFLYHKGTANAYGWYLLDTKTDQEVDSVKYDVFYFGYNKRLAPNDATVTLFDTVQLKSFIDEEITGAVKINVFAYGIQAENLGLDLQGDASYLTEADVRAIYAVVGRKQVM